MKKTTNMILLTLAIAMMVGCSSDPNVPGVPGPQGERGLPGTVDGSGTVNGVNGKDGKNGTNGVDGTNGTNGVDGQDAVASNGGDGSDADGGGLDGDNGSNGSDADAGADNGDDGHNTYYVVSTTLCQGADLALYNFGYNVVRYSNGDVWVSCSVANTETQSSNSQYYDASQPGAMPADCFVTSAPSNNSGGNQTFGVWHFAMVDGQTNVVFNKLGSNVDDYSFIFGACSTFVK